MKKIQMTWAMYDILVQQMSEHYQDQSIDLIVGLKRGGLPLAVSLSHKLNIPMDVLDWQTRDGKGRDLCKLTDFKNQFTHGGVKILFVDDICDSGLTISDIKHIFPEARFTVLVDKLKNNKLVDYVPNRIRGGFDNDDVWVTFPWEKLTL